MRPKTLLSWSSGKDSAWTLHVLRQRQEVDVVGLLTTVNTTHDRVAMHAVRRELLERQAEALGLPLMTVPLPWPCSNEEYEAAMTRAIVDAKGKGVTHMAFGDLFLEDVRKYRESRLSGTGIVPLFPIWGIPTGELATQMVDSGLKARITCIDPKRLASHFAGRDFGDVLAELPEGVDPCGENGEFHSFAYEGPMFRRPVAIRTGDVVEREGFVFADLLPG